MRSRDRKRERFEEEEEFLSPSARALRAELSDFHWAIDQLNLLDRVSDSYSRKKGLRETLLKMINSEVELGPPLEDTPHFQFHLEEPTGVDPKEILVSTTSSKPDQVIVDPINAAELVLWFLRGMTGFRYSLIKLCLQSFLKQNPSMFLYHPHYRVSTEPKDGNVSLPNPHESSNFEENRDE